MKHLRLRPVRSAFAGATTGATTGALGALLSLGSCSPAGTAPVVALAGHQATVSRGTILAMRPLEPSAGAASRVLEGLSAAATPTQGGLVPGQAVDFVIRDAGGATIAVVQTNELHFQVGEPVLIVRGDPTRLSRPGA